MEHRKVTVVEEEVLASSAFILLPMYILNK